MSDIDLKLCDLLEFSKMCAPEYNMPELSDRILVIDVMQDGWETAGILNNISTTEITESCEETSSTLVRQNSSEKPPNSETSETPQSEEKSLNNVESRETGTDLEYESENKSKNLQNVPCEQDTKLTFPEDTTENTSVNMVTKTEQPKSSDSPNDFDQPLRQHRIHIHTFWLSVQSPYFRSLFYSSGMKENLDKEVHVKVSESEEKAYLILLEAMYCGDVLNDKTVGELLAVLELANKYDLKFIFKKCKYVLQKNATTFEVSTQMMQVIKVKHDMSDVEELATTIGLVLAKEFSPLDNNWKSEKFTNLSQPSLKYLLGSDDLTVQCENTVFHALMHWMEQNKTDPTSTSDLLCVVRFKLMMVDYLYNVVKDHVIASKMPKYDELFLNAMIYHALPAPQKKFFREQPLVRKDPEAIFQCTVVVDRQNFKAAQEAERYESSDVFWACGYEMSVHLCCTRNRFNDQCTYAGLYVRNLNEESFAPLQFLIEKSGRSINSWQEQNFTHDCNTTNYLYMALEQSDFNNDSKACNLYIAVKPIFSAR